MEIARKSIFDLERRCNLLEEYNQIVIDLKSTFVDKKNLVWVLDRCIRTWPYRQGATNIESFASSHGFSAFNDTSEADILLTLELLINLLYWAPYYEKQCAGPFTLSLGEESETEKECTRCIQNIEYLLERINMRIREKELPQFSQYVISKRNTHVDAAIEAVPQLSDVLLSYLDIRNQKDEDAKKAVLRAIADYLEQKRKDGNYKGTSYNGLCEDLFAVFNNASIRHKNNNQWKLRKPERIKLYDQTFNAAIHLLQKEDVDAFQAEVKRMKESLAVGDGSRCSDKTPK